MPLILLLLACGEPPNPAEASLGAAVRAWRRGDAALEAGRASEAREAFAEAIEARPGDALLHAWAGRAAGLAGDLDGALVALDRALRLSPELGPARLLRARYRARAGDPSGAADDVLGALQAGAITPRGVLRDPVLGALHDDPAFAFLPEAPLEASLRVPVGVAYWGSEVDVTLDVVGAVAGPLTIRGPAEGPAELVRVVEEDVLGDDGDRVRTIRWTLRVDGPGALQVGPLTIHQDGVDAPTNGVTVPTDAPPGREGVARELPLPTPAAVLGDRLAPSAWRDAEVTWVAVPPGGWPTVRPPRSLPIPWTLSRDGAPIVELVRVTGPVEHVTVRLDGAVVLDAPPQD